ncbi:hypothetical protein Nepgr_019942 [Nepenthes gracilis]|uniref:Uncharacterized protein n=1 Tax=Nepenthes gracilis TaxID=150966 RepID=A0AAD3SW84_NEPGR|nr:hypothetical protein Nepgr_019942 [Nepenthes gracilis]
MACRRQAALTICFKTVQASELDNRLLVTFAISASLKSLSIFPFFRTMSPRPCHSSRWHLRDHFAEIAGAVRDAHKIAISDTTAEFDVLMIEPGGAAAVISSTDMQGFKTMATILWQMGTECLPPCEIQEGGGMRIIISQQLQKQQHLNANVI